MFAFTWSPLINIDWRRNKCNICYKCFVRLLDYWMTEMLKMHKLCLFIPNGICIITLRFLSAIDHMILGWKVPNDNLTIKTAADKHIRVIRMPLNGSYFDWCIKQICQRDDIIVLEIKYKKLGIERFSLNDSSCVEIHVIYHTHGNEVRSCWMEFNAGDSFILTIITVKERPCLHSCSVDFSTLCSFVVT